MEYFILANKYEFVKSQGLNSPSKDQAPKFLDDMNAGNQSSTRPSSKPARSTCFGINTQEFNQDKAQSDSELTHLPINLNLVTPHSKFKLLEKECNQRTSTPQINLDEDSLVKQTGEGMQLNFDDESRGNSQSVKIQPVQMVEKFNVANLGLTSEDQTENDEPSLERIKISENKMQEKAFMEYSRLPESIQKKAKVKQIDIIRQNRSKKSSFALGPEQTLENTLVHSPATSRRRSSLQDSLLKLDLKKTNSNRCKCKCTLI